MIRVRTFFASMTGRVFVILALGLGLAALVAVAVTDAKSKHDFEVQLRERTADRLQVIVTFLDAAPKDLRRAFIGFGGPGIRLQPPGATGISPDSVFQNVAQRARRVAANGDGAERGLRDVLSGDSPARSRGCPAGAGE